MPYAQNEIDGTRIYFEDDGGDGPTVIFSGGILDVVQSVRRSEIARGVSNEEFRKVFVDHRGLGKSDKPHDVQAYAMPRRVDDTLSVLDAIGVERAHFVGTSWGGRLGFGVGEYAPQRIASLVLGGQQPYAIDPDGPLTQRVGAGIEASQTRGMEAFVETLEEASELRFPEPERSWYIEQDPKAVRAAWKSALDEGAVASDLGSWQMPCLIFAGSNDVDFHDLARRAADEIPKGRFISIEADDHVGAHMRNKQVIPLMLEQLRGRH